MLVSQWTLYIPMDSSLSSLFVKIRINSLRTGTKEGEFLLQFFIFIFFLTRLISGHLVWWLLKWLKLSHHSSVNHHWWQWRRFVINNLLLSKILKRFRPTILHYTILLISHSVSCSKVLNLSNLILPLLYLRRICILCFVFSY